MAGAAVVLGGGDGGVVASADAVAGSGAVLGLGGAVVGLGSAIGVLLTVG